VGEARRMRQRRPQSLVLGRSGVCGVTMKSKGGGTGRSMATRQWQGHGGQEGAEMSLPPSSSVFTVNPKYW
jgi:hypothetical protein